MKTNKEELIELISQRWLAFKVVEISKLIVRGLDTYPDFEEALLAAIPDIEPYFKKLSALGYGRLPEEFVWKTPPAVERLVLKSTISDAMIAKLLPKMDVTVFHPKTNGFIEKPFITLTRKEAKLLIANDRLRSPEEQKTQYLSDMQRPERSKKFHEVRDGALHVYRKHLISRARIAQLGRDLGLVVTWPGPGKI